MELELKVYKTRSLKAVEKTYKENDFRLSFGACEDILHAINIELFTGNLDALSEEGKAAELTKMVIDALPVIKDILKDVFEGLTDDELKRTSIQDIVKVVVSIITYATTSLNRSVPEKN